MDQQTSPLALPRLYVNCIADLDWLIALEFGRVDEGQPEDAWTAVSGQFGYLFDGDRCVGFKVLNLTSFDIDSDEHEAIWSGARFDAPTLALTAASAGEIVLAARTMFNGRSSLNRLYFNEAINAETKDEALAEWLGCVEAGDSMAHYGLGIALFDSGKTLRAYTHLRFYATIAPLEPWAQYWYARAAAAIEETEEAIAALERALELGGDENLTELAEKLKDEIADGE
jgi:tetratricopeptide (TPR) repeat protein